MFILLVASALAVSPFTPQYAGTLTIENPKLPYYYQDADGFDAYWHVFNSTGHALSAPTYNCTIHVYNKSAIHVFEAQAVMEGSDYEVEFGPNITNNPQEYGFIIWCANGPGKEAGAISGTFTISNSNNDVTSYYSIFAVIIAIIVFLLWIGFKLDESHAPIKLFLVWLTFGLFVLLVSFLQQYAVYTFMGESIVNSINTLYYVVIILLWVVFAYFIFYYLATLLKYINDQATDKRWWGKRDAKDKSG